MNRVAFVADVHVDNHARMGGEYVAGLNSRCRAVAKGLYDSVQLAMDNACCAYVVLGDLVDTTHPKPQVLAAIADALEDTGHMVGQCHLLVGNHDQESYAIGDHALGPLKGTARIVDRPICVRLRDADMLLVPFQPGPAVDWLDEAVAEAAKGARDPIKRPRLLGIHLGIIHDGTPPFLRDSHDAVPIGMIRELQKKYGLQAVAAGNWHRHHDFGGGVMQIGALVPNGFKDDGLEHYGSHVEWESSTKPVFHRTQIPGPRFVTIHGLPEPRELDTALANQLHVRCYAEQAEMTEAHERLAAADLTAFEVLPDKQEAIISSRDAAQAASSQDSTDDALMAYVMSMPLDDGVDRAQVLKRAREFMRGQS